MSEYAFHFVIIANANELWCQHALALAVVSIERAHKQILLVAAHQQRGRGCTITRERENQILTFETTTAALHILEKLKV